ncbi:serine hydrolase [Fluviicola taffensis]|uniref:serine hydrolase domain-containing protein n=1 Tax=Fluviicola taffensis TaxID=191579 RepID=UPI0031381EB9
MIRLALLIICPILFSRVIAQIDQSAKHQFDSLFKTHFEKGFNGNVLYAKRGNIMYSGNFGLTKYVDGIPLNDSTLFELGSNAKQFTALAIMQLIEKDSIALSSDIQTILIDFPYPGITIEHLLQHQSGLPDYMELFKNRKVWDRKKIADNNDVYRILKERKPELLFQPGSKFTYSNTGYLILCMIIEKVSGLTFDAYLHQFVFGPSEMKRSAVIRRRYQPVVLPNNTEGYQKILGKYRIRNTIPRFSCAYLDGVQGDGSISTTILDMKSWIDALQNNVLISEKSKELMFTPDSVSLGYGFGFFIGTDGIWKDIIYHGGNWAGYYTWMYYERETEDFVVILCNNAYNKTPDIFIAMREAILKAQKTDLE